MQSTQNLSTLDLLSRRYNVLVSIDELAEIFRKSRRYIYIMLNNGDLPIKPIHKNHTEKRLAPLYRLTDVAAYIDGTPVTSSSLTDSSSTAKKRGRPLGSRNRKRDMASPPCTGELYTHEYSASI